MLTLAIDSSSSSCSVAIMSNRIISNKVKAHMERGHGTAIMPMIQKAIHESNFSLSIVNSFESFKRFKILLFVLKIHDRGAVKAIPSRCIKRSFLNFLLFNDNYQ